MNEQGDAQEDSHGHQKGHVVVKQHQISWTWKGSKRLGLS